MNRRTVGISPPTTPTYGPALFLQRPDFVSMLHENEVILRYWLVLSASLASLSLCPFLQAALAAYNASPIVKHIVHRIRKCGEPTEKYENNRYVMGRPDSQTDRISLVFRDFVAFVNLFADDTQPLPMNWQASGRNPVSGRSLLLFCVLFGISYLMPL